MVTGLVQSAQSYFMQMIQICNAEEEYCGAKQSMQCCGVEFTFDSTTYLDRGRVIFIAALPLKFYLHRLCQPRVRKDRLNSRCTYRDVPKSSRTRTLEILPPINPLSNPFIDVPDLPCSTLNISCHLLHGCTLGIKIQLTS